MGKWSFFRIIKKLIIELMFFPISSFSIIKFDESTVILIVVDIIQYPPSLSPFLLVNHWLLTKLIIVIRNSHCLILKFNPWFQLRKSFFLRKSGIDYFYLTLIYFKVSSKEIAYQIILKKSSKRICFSFLL